MIQSLETKTPGQLGSFSASNGPGKTSSVWQNEYMLRFVNVISRVFGMITWTTLLILPKSFAVNMNDRIELR